MSRVSSMTTARTGRSRVATTMLTSRRDDAVDFKVPRKPWL